jgi:hypothetical protein
VIADLEPIVPREEKNKTRKCVSLKIVHGESDVAKAPGRIHFRAA